MKKYRVVEKPLAGVRCGGNETCSVFGAYVTDEYGICPNCQTHHVTLMQEEYEDEA